ncbi:MAG: hypothetical protein V2A73_21950, partial [Pseudomonadota bacterium]
MIMPRKDSIHPVALEQGNPKLSEVWVTTVERYRKRRMMGHREDVPGASCLRCLELVLQPRGLVGQRKAMGIGIEDEKTRLSIGEGVVPLRLSGIGWQHEPLAKRIDAATSALAVVIADRRIEHVRSKQLPLDAEERLPVLLEI